MTVFSNYFLITIAYKNWKFIKIKILLIKILQLCCKINQQQILLIMNNF